MSSKLVLVLGMHRAGTSALTGVLTKLGTHTIHDPDGVGPDNPKGFFEALSVMQINEHLLTCLGSGWDDLAPIEDLPRPNLIDEVKNFLSQHIRQGEINVVKDPRLSRLGSIWIDAAHQLELPTQTIIACRHPTEVANSLRVRNGFSMDTGVHLWCRYMLDAEKVSRRTPRTTVFMSALLNNWRAVIADVSDQLGLALDQNSNATEVDQFLDKGLRHHLTNDYNAISPVMAKIANYTFSKFEHLNRHYDQNYDKIFDEIRQRLENYLNTTQ